MSEKKTMRKELSLQLLWGDPEIKKSESTGTGRTHRQAQKFKLRDRGGWKSGLLPTVITFLIGTVSGLAIFAK